MLDATVVNVALPHIGEDFNASVSALQWVLTGYLLALGLADPARRRAGRPVRAPQGLRDRHGVVRRRVAAVRRGAEHRGARRRPGAAGRRRGAAHPRQPGDPAGELRPGRSGQGRGRVVRARRCRRRASGRSSAAGSSTARAGAGRSSSTCPSPRSPWCARGTPCPRRATRTRRAALDVRRRRAGGGQPRRGDVGADRGRATRAGPTRRSSAPAIVALVGIAAFVRRMLHTDDPLVPPSLFRSREFTVTNLATVLLYSAHRGLVLPRVLRAPGRGGLVGPGGRDGAAAGHAAHAPVLGRRPAALAQRIGPRAPAHRRPADPRRRPAPADPHRSRHVVGRPTCCPARSCSASGS